MSEKYTCLYGRAILRLAKENQKLAAERDELKKECEEQARLNGMGSEREARLMAKADTLYQELLGMVYHGCLTGDCPHDNNAQCWDALQKASAEAVTEMENNPGQALLDRVRRLEAVEQAARKVEAIYWDFDKSMKIEVEELKAALAALDEAK